LEKAVNLFKESIKHNDNTESSIKDLAMLLVQLGRNKEAIDIILKNQKKVKNPESLNTLLIQVYQKTDLHEKALELLQKRLVATVNKDKKAQILWQVANSYFNLKDYARAEKMFSEVLNLNPEDIAAQKILHFVYPNKDIMIKQ
jgi:tetratricopeptide (TPR) repeat protein